MMTTYLLRLFVLTSVVWGVYSQNSTDAKNLREKLFVTDGYDKRILPLLNQASYVEVYVNFYLLAINGLDEVTETLKTTGYLWVTWTDEFLVWDRATYGDIQYYMWPQNDLWIPDVTLKNSILDYKDLGSPNLKVQVSYDGEVNWYPFQVFQSTCSVDITYFPFDVQTCHLSFGAWSYSSAEVVMHGGRNGINLDEYEPSSLWDVVDSSMFTDEDGGEAIIRFTIKMKRKPLYFILSVIMPILMLAVLNVFVFTLPCESGERAGYAITVFLALAVFLTIVAESLPANSETTAIFAIYVIIQTLQSTFTTILALWMIRLSTKETKIPSCLDKFTHLVWCLQCKRQKCITKVQPDRMNNVRVSKSSLQITEQYSDTAKENGTFPFEDTDNEIDPDEKVTWSLAVRAIDFCLFILCLSILVLSTSICFVLAGTAN